MNDIKGICKAIDKVCDCITSLKERDENKTKLIKDLEKRVEVLEEFKNEATKDWM